MPTRCRGPSWRASTSAGCRCSSWSTGCRPTPTTERRSWPTCGACFAEAGLDGLLTHGRDATPRDLVAVREGDLDASGERLVAARSRRCSMRSARLRADREARIELATRALTGSLAGLGESLDRIADDADHETIDVEALRRLADRSYENALVALRQEIGQGTFLREEALRHWQSFVGADQMTRFFSEGIGRIRGAIAAVFRPATAPVAEMRAATTDDLLAVARLQAAEAARRTATAWADEPGMGPVMAEDADLWLPSPDFDARLRGRHRGLDREHRRGHPASTADPSGRLRAARRSASTCWARASCSGPSSIPGV